MLLSVLYIPQYSLDMSTAWRMVGSRGAYEDTKGDQDKVGKIELKSQLLLRQKDVAAEVERRRHL